jgi:uncharacterized RDD family membrane protein YckC
MPTKKQFDLSHIHVDSKWQGSLLASFGRRTVAYLIDWSIVLVCTQYLWVSILVLVALIAFRKRYQTSLQRGSIYMRYSLRKLNNELEKHNIEQSLRSRLTRHLTWYIYIIVFGPVVVCAVVLLGIVLGILAPNDYGALSEKYVQGTMLFHPFKDIYNGFTFVAGLLGGLFYFSLFTWRWQGQTPGKRLMRIKVVKLNGTPISLWNSVERFSGYSSSASLLLLGFFQYYWDRNHQTTHDKISETIVVQV